MIRLVRQPFQNAQRFNGVHKNQEEIMPAQNTSTEIPTQYDPDLFVDRKNEIKEIEGIIKSVSQGQDVDEHTIRISGERGVGKSWLLRHIHHTLLHSNKADIISIYASFDHPTSIVSRRENDQSERNRIYTARKHDERGLRDLLRDITRGLKGLTADDAKLSEQSQWLVNQLRAMGHKTIVWLLDGLFDVPQAFLEGLETYLLNRIVEGERWVIVMSGRGRAPLFTHHDLTIQSKDILLGPLGKGTVEKKDGEEGLYDLFERLAQSPAYHQLGEQGKNRIDTIYRISGGYPRTALLLARTEDLGEGVKQALDELLSFITEETERSKIRQHLEALSILSRWRPDLESHLEETLRRKESDLKAMKVRYLGEASFPYIEWGVRDPDGVRLLNAYAFFTQHQKEVQSQSLETLYEEFIAKGLRYYDRVAFWRVRNHLQKYQLLRWDIKQKETREYKGYFVEEAIRFPLAYDLRVNSPRLWQWLHYVAYRLFDTWSEKYDREKYGPLALAHYVAYLEVERTEKPELVLVPQ